MERPSIAEQKSKWLASSPDGWANVCYVLGSLGEQLPPIFGGTLETYISKSQGKHRFHRSETARPKLPNMIAETYNIMIDWCNAQPRRTEMLEMDLLPPWQMSSLLMLVWHFKKPCSFPTVYRHLKKSHWKPCATNSGNFPTGNGTALSKFHRLRSILLPCFGLVGCLGAFGHQRVLRARCGGCLSDAWFIMVHHHLPSENG